VKLEKERRQLDLRLKQLTEAQDRLLPSILAGPYAALPPMPASNSTAASNLPNHHHVLLRIEFLCERYTKAIERLQERIKKIKNEKKALQRNNQRLRIAIDAHGDFADDLQQHAASTTADDSFLTATATNTSKVIEDGSSIMNPVAVEALLQQNEELRQLLQSSLETLEAHQQQQQQQQHETNQVPASELHAAQQRIAELEQQLQASQSAVDQQGDASTIAKLSVKHLCQQAEQLVAQDAALTQQAGNLTTSSSFSFTLSPSNNNNNKNNNNNDDDATTTTVTMLDVQDSDNEQVDSTATKEGTDADQQVAALLEQNAEQQEKIQQLSAFGKLLQERIRQPTNSPSTNASAAATAIASSSTVARAHSSVASDYSAITFVQHDEDQGEQGNDDEEDDDNDQSYHHHRANNSTAALAGTLVQLPKFVQKLLSDHPNDCCRFVLEFNEYICTQHLQQTRVMNSLLADNDYLIAKCDSVCGR
jgi:hypothetical protein